MAAVLETKRDPAEKFNTQVDEQIAQATSRIRDGQVITIDGGKGIVALGE